MDNIMATDKFLAIMRKAAEKMLKEENSTINIDWDKRRSWWTQQIGHLYTNIENWLKPLIDDEILKTNRISIEIQEEMLGSYRTEKLELTLGSNKISLLPIGSIIIGAFGRVDVEGSNGRTRMILTPPKGEDVAQYMNKAIWHIADFNNNQTLIELNQEEFLRIVSRLFGLIVE